MFPYGGKKMPYFDWVALKEWFKNEKRSLPWRENPSPYAVWVSEVMLQQTQASVVIPYFEKWMRRFPTIQALAFASSDEVIKLWEGLGYYSRARNLHLAAKQLLQENQGKLPHDENALEKIRGIGPYTKGAILSFAFHKKAAAVDGNVLRVLARYFLIEEEIEKAKPKITQLTQEILPDQEPWIVMEAIIELGAQICKKTPLCSSCPLKKSCLAHLHRKEMELPLKKKRKETTFLHRAVGVIACKGELLVGKVVGKRVMADLYEFPYVEVNHPKNREKGLLKKMEQEFNIRAQILQELSPVKHTFTRYVATLYPFLLKGPTKIEIPQYEWIPLGRLLTLPFSSGHRRILKELKDAHFAH